MAKLYANDTIGRLTVSDDYREQLQKEHSGSKWGTTGAKYSGADVLSLLTDRPYIKSVLDFGAGKGTMEQFIREYLKRDIEWTNYDPGMPAYDVLPDGQFDLVMSSDVIEHIEPDRLSNAFKQMQALTGKVLFADIACYPTGKVFGEGPYTGQDLHLTLKTPEEWRQYADQQFDQLQLFEYRASERLSKGTLKERCMLVYERV